VVLNEPLTLELATRTVSVANTREHWAAKASRAKRHRGMAWAEMRYAFGQPVFLSPLKITLTRIAPRQLDDDNLRSALKATRDGIADWLTIDDGDPRLSWEYAQEKGKPKQYAIRIEVAPCDMK
jgi:hypothetical protein